MYWKLNRLQYPIYNLGPGRRIGIWVQGCSIRCSGCISPSLWNHNKGKLINIEYLVDAIGAIEEDYNGITISGGEPFDQYEALIVFCAFVKERTPLSIFVFSGYYIDELVHKYPDKLFLKYLDYLMDGRYEMAKHGDRNVRGSSNQNFYRIEADSAVVQNEFFQGDRWSVYVSDDDQVFLSGIPKRGELKKISSSLKNLGINAEFE